ncbi:MAG: YitT family protein [Chloroflexota bacterium]
MFKPIHWKTLPRDFVVIQIGFALFGIAIAMLIHANLGTNPWVMLSVALSDIFGLSVGTITVLVGFSVLAVALLMRERVGWGTLGNILFIGPWTDLFLWLIPSVTDNWLLQGAMLLGSILIMGIATGIYIGVNAGAGPRDTLMLAVQCSTGWSLRRARSTIELCVFVAGWLLGGPFGIGTIVVALLIGPAVQWGFRLFNVERAAPVVAERPFVNT